MICDYRFVELNFQRNPRDHVVVRVPATTANLGPGFDSLGMAVDIWSEISVQRAEKFSIEVSFPKLNKIPV